MVRPKRQTCRRRQRVDDIHHPATFARRSEARRSDRRSAQRQLRPVDLRRGARHQDTIHLRALHRDLPRLVSRWDADRLRLEPHGTI